MDAHATGDTDVLVVGAGPTGLTLACALLRRGVRCRVIDRAPSPATTSRALGLQPRTLEILDDLGIVERVLAQGGPVAGAKLYDGDTLLLTLSAAGIARCDTAYPASGSRRRPASSARSPSCWKNSAGGSSAPAS